MLSSLDWFVIGLYFVAVFSVAIWCKLTEDRSDAKSSDYFLAGRHAGWFVIGASLFASNIGSEHLIGLAGTGAASGLAVGQFEIIASLMLLLLGWVFVPIYLRIGVFTMPEFLERRYAPGARWYLAVISIIAYVLTKISVTIAAGGIVFETMMGMNFWTGAIIVVIATGVYTIFGGLKAVLYTDMLQMFVLLGGSLAITIIGFQHLGGWDEMVRLAGPDYMSVWRPMSDPAFPWTGVLFGAPILGVWYWCTDQVIVQRVLSGKNISHARGGALFAGYLKLLPLFLFVMPGLIAYGLKQKGMIELSKSDEALPTLMAALLPVGLKGFAVAGLLAALMSSLSSVFNSCSTLITCDIYQKLKPAASEKQLLWVGQISTAFMVILGLLWIPIIKNISGQLYQYLQSVQAYISPPIASVFLLGVLWPKANSIGALVSLWLGFVMGMGRLVLELYKAELDPQGILFFYADINFLHFAILLFVICSAAHVVLSLMSPSENRSIHGKTVRLDDAKKGGIPWDAVFSVLLGCAVLGLWMYFS